MKEKTKRITYIQKLYQAKWSPKKWKQNRDTSKKAEMMKIFQAYDKYNSKAIQMFRAK